MEMPSMEIKSPYLIMRSDNARYINKHILKLIMMLTKSKWIMSIKVDKVGNKFV